MSDIDLLVECSACGADPHRRCAEEDGLGSWYEVPSHQERVTDALVADRDRLAARVGELEKEASHPPGTVAGLRIRERRALNERDAYRSMVCDLLASAHPHPTEHPTMTAQWKRARDLLKNGPTTKDPAR